VSLLQKIHEAIGIFAYHQSNDVKRSIMAEPFLSEIRIMSFTFAPKGWAFCNGQILPIQQNAALFSLLGTTYGGNGVQTFGLPDLRGRVPLYTDNNQYPLGAMAGTPSVTILTSEMPAHTHTLLATKTAATTTDPTSQSLAIASDALGNVYTTASQPNTVMAAQAITPTGGTQPHTNLQPYLSLNFCIAMVGIFPSRG
jgi:microcystin-dependent protein